MTTPIEFVRDTYNNDDYRVPTYEVLIGPNSGLGWLPLTGELDIEIRFDIGKVPTGSIHHANIGAVDVQTFAAFFKNIIIREGFRAGGAGSVGAGTNITVFTGRILDINEDERYLEITFQGQSWPLDVAFHTVIETFDNIENNASMTAILDQAGILDYSVSMPTWQIGTVAPQVLQFQTYGEALQKVADVGGGAWFETPDGILILRDLYVLDHFNTTAGAVGTYWAAALAGSVETPPAGCTGRPRLRNWRRTNDVRKTFNAAYVTGCTVQQINSDGSIDNIDIFGYADAPSSYVLNPDGTQGFNVQTFGSELIDQLVKAGTEAGRIVDLENGMHETYVVTVPGDPTLALAQNRRIADARKGLDRYAIVTGYTTHLGGGQYTSTVDLLFIDSADAAHIAPYALFSHHTLLEVKTNAVKGLVALDGSLSFSPAGGITNYQFVDNQTPHVINQSSASPHAVGLYNPASLSTTPLKVTLTVTDSFGTTRSTTLTVPVAQPSVGGTVVMPNFWVADDWFLSRSLDGGQHWTDTNEAAGISSVAAFPTISAYVLTSAGALYGSDDGRLYNVDSGGVTLVFSGLGSKVAFIAFDYNVFDRVWMLLENGKLYKSDGGWSNGLTWDLWDDLRVIYGVPSMMCTRIATPPSGGIWIYGGDGGPLFMVDFDQGHHWL